MGISQSRTTMKLPLLRCVGECYCCFRCTVRARIFCILLTIYLELVCASSEMGVDVLVSGHTHKLNVRQGSEGGLYINPGTVRLYLRRKIQRDYVALLN